MTNARMIAFCFRILLFCLAPLNSEASVSSSISFSLNAMKLEGLPMMSSAPQYNYTVDLKGWIKCAEKLKNCHPARFSLPNPAQIAVLKMAITLVGGKRADARFYTQEDIDTLIQNAYQDYIIQGWKKEKCCVSIEAKSMPKYYASGYPLDEAFVKQMFPITKVTCNFNEQELSVLSKSALQMDKENRDFSVDEKAGEILARACYPVQN